MKLFPDANFVFNIININHKVVFVKKKSKNFFSLKRASSSSDFHKDSTLFFCLNLKKYKLSTHHGLLK